MPLSLHTHAVKCPDRMPGSDPGTGPQTLYKALRRGATGRWVHPADHDWISHLTRHPNASALYQAITTPHGQLRLSWAGIR